MNFMKKSSGNILIKLPWLLQVTIQNGFVKEIRVTLETTFCLRVSDNNNIEANCWCYTCFIFIFWKKNFLGVLTRK